MTTMTMPKDDDDNDNNNNTNATKTFWNVKKVLDYIINYSVLFIFEKN